MNNRQPWQLKKINIVGAVLELPAKQHCQFSPFGPFSWGIGINYSFELIFIETYAPQFIGHNKFFPRQCEQKRKYCRLQKYTFKLVLYSVDLLCKFL